MPQSNCHRLNHQIEIEANSIICISSNILECIPYHSVSWLGQLSLSQSLRLVFRPSSLGQSLGQHRCHQQPDLVDWICPRAPHSIKMAQYFFDLLYNFTDCMCCFPSSPQLKINSRSFKLLRLLGEVRTLQHFWDSANLILAREDSPTSTSSKINPHPSCSR